MAEPLIDCCRGRGSGGARRGDGGRAVRRERGDEGGDVLRGAGLQVLDGGARAASPRTPHRRVLLLGRRGAPRPRLRLRPPPPPPLPPTRHLHRQGRLRDQAHQQVRHHRQEVQEQGTLIKSPVDQF